ncbi:MAG TPA: YgaP-like transmembrane domain [Acidimicrobiales bacterium]
MGFFRFMATSAGRLVRVVAGVVMIVIGLVAGGGWCDLAVVGFVPLLAAAFDVCGFAPLFG